MGFRSLCRRDGANAEGFRRIINRVSICHFPRKVKLFVLTIPRAFKRDGLTWLSRIDLAFPGEQRIKCYECRYICLSS